MEENPEVKKAILQAVEDQLNSPETPYVKKHLMRLVLEGMPEPEAKELIALVLMAELWQMNKDERNFNTELYQSRLAKLPDIDWYSEDE